MKIQVVINKKNLVAFSLNGKCILYFKDSMSDAIYEEILESYLLEF